MRCAPVDGGEQPVAQPVAQRRHPRRRRGALGRHQAQRRGQPDRARHVLGAAAPLALLPAAVLAGLEHDPAGDGERADADRTADLVRAERDQVGAGRDLGQVEPGRGLHGVGEHVRRWGRGGGSSL